MGHYHPLYAAHHTPITWPVCGMIHAVLHGNINAVLHGIISIITIYYMVAVFCLIGYMTRYMYDYMPSYIHPLHEYLAYYMSGVHHLSWRGRVQLFLLILGPFHGP
jgi:ABC-type xylose transport system permease subunit